MHLGIIGQVFNEIFILCIITSAHSSQIRMFSENKIINNTIQIYKSWIFLNQVKDLDGPFIILNDDIIFLRWVSFVLQVNLGRRNIPISLILLFPILLIKVILRQNIVAFDARLLFYCIYHGNIVPWSFCSNCRYVYGIIISRRSGWKP